MIEALAELSADAMEYLRDIGLKKSMRLINDDIVNIIPFNSRYFSSLTDKSKISFLPFYNKIKKKIQRI